MGQAGRGPPPRAPRAGGDVCRNVHSAPHCRAVPGASELRPGSTLQQRTAQGRARLTLDLDPSNRHHGCSRWEEASAADGAPGFPRGPGRQRGPVGEALLASPLLGRTPGGSGGIGPNADVIPAPLEGEGQVNRLEGVKGQRPSFQRLKDPRGTLPRPPTSSTPGPGLWPHSPGPRGRRARPLTPMP